MGSAATVVVTIEGQNNDKHVLEIAHALWRQDPEAVMHRLREAIDGLVGIPFRFDTRHTCSMIPDTASKDEVFRYPARSFMPGGR